MWYETVVNDVHVLLENPVGDSLTYGKWAIIDREIVWLEISAASRCNRQCNYNFFSPVPALETTKRAEKV